MTVERKGRAVAAEHRWFWLTGLFHMRRLRSWDGHIEDMVLDKLSNNIVFAIVGFSGFFGMGAATSFALFSVGAVFPILPFVWMHGAVAVATSLAVSAAALCAIGVLTSLFNGRSPWFSAARQAVFGCAAAAVTYGIGAALGVSLS